VTFTAQVSGADHISPAHAQEALLLVELLRTSRLSVLYAERGSDKTALLRSGLMPLLCRRAGDRSIPTAARSSGVVVPFPDRRNRPSPRSSRRRREIVVYCGEWTDRPSDAFRDSLYKAVAADPFTHIESSAHLSETLEDLSQRFDANFVVLLDRLEDLLQESPYEAATVRFVNELAEAVNQPLLPANFLISLAEEARPRLAAFRARIPGFDDFSLKLSPARDAENHPASAPIPERAPPMAPDALPVLTEPVIAPAARSATRPAEHAPALRSTGRLKVKREPLPRREVTVEDVYTMIGTALSRIRAPNEPPCSPPEQREESLLYADGAVEPILVDSSAATGSTYLRRAIERMERRLGVGPDGPDSASPPA
jgi:hypothetical protein